MTNSFNLRVSGPQAYYRRSYPLTQNSLWLVQSVLLSLRHGLDLTGLRVVGGGPTGVEVAADMADFLAGDATDACR